MDEALSKKAKDSKQLMIVKSKDDGTSFGVAALNEGLMLGLVRQHELIEAAKLMNAQLQAEIIGRKS